MTSKTAPKKKLTKAERRAKYTARARDRQNDLRFKHTVCYNCRETGHTANHCPRENTSKRVCYKCGSQEHNLASCSANEPGLPYATCFVCKLSGHLASACPKNEKGIFVKGGACKVCGSKGHRGKHCPEKTKKANHQRSNSVTEQDFSDLLIAEPNAHDPESNSMAAEKKSKDSSRKGKTVYFS